MTTTIGIIGTDFRGPEHRISVRPDGTVHPWRRQPFADGGRLQLDRTRVEDWKNIFYELCDLARLPCIAIGIRGAYTDYDTNWRAPALDAYRMASPQPTLMPWFDTVGLPDMVNLPNSGTYKFDFANSAHLDIAWEWYARVFFDTFADCKLERSPNGKVLCAWWGIAPDTGHGFRNQTRAQRLLDYIDQRLAVLGLGGADHIVDHTWLELCPGLHVFGVHDWFDGWGSIDPPRPPTPYTIRNHNGVTVGVAVPSFYDRINPDGNAETIRTALAAMRAAKADYILIESGTNFQEDAELMRDASGNTHKLDAVREHMQLIGAVPAEPPTLPIHGALMHLAVTTTPILEWKTGLLVQSPLAPNRYAMRWTQHPNEAGFPDPTSSQFMCLNPNGSTEAKDVIGEWESSQPVDEQAIEVRWFTINAAGDESATKVYGLQQFRAA